MSGYSIDYHRLQQLADQAGLQQSSAEMHGRMLGMICVDNGANRDVLDKLACDEIVRGKASGILAQAAERLYQETWHALDGVGLGFDLMLPEEASHAERCQALVDWARGFLRGLAIVGVHGSHDLSLNGRHALADIARIAECDPGNISDNEEGYEEACEFVWVTAVLVRELLNVEHAND